MRILLLDDDDDVLEGVAQLLRKDGHVVTVLSTIAEADERLADDTFDVLVLDRALPDGNVVDHLRRWQGRGVNARILLLTAASSVRDRIEGLTAGSDDYLGKPFAFAELVARVRALGRRPATPPLKELRLGDLRIDLERRAVTRAGIALPLRPKELAVLEALARRSPRPVSRAALRALVWDDDLPAASNVDEVTIGSLRRKLGLPDVIETVRGVGWALVGR